MKIELKLSGDEDAYIVKNLWPLYQHEVSEFDACKPNRHGLFGVDDRVMTLSQHGPGAWWTDSASLFPYLILVDGAPAGFNLVAAQSRLRKGADADFGVEEFFVLHAYRGKGVAERAATEGFDAHEGRWEVLTWPTNSRAISFWRRAIGSYTSEGHSEGEIDHPTGRKVAFHFAN
jgi:predicted acetyltransferase